MIQIDNQLECLEIIVMACSTFANYSIINLKFCDYVNFYLIKNADNINVFKLIDVLILLTKFEYVINYQLMNYLYDKVKL